jgi:hypothetical protein
MINHHRAGRWRRALHRSSLHRSSWIELPANPIDAAGVLCIAWQIFVAAIGEAA